VRAVPKKLRRGERQQLVRPRFRDELRAVLDSMLEGVVVVDNTGQVTHINGVARTLLELQGSLGQRFEEISNLKMVREPVRRVLAGGAAEAQQVRRTLGLREQVIQLRTAPLHGKKNVLAGAVVVLHDVSELDRLATIRQEFISNASHELKTPITAILAMAETLVEEPDTDPERHRHFLMRIREQARRMGSIVSDLLTLSRLESPDLGFNMEVLSLADTVREVFDTLAPLAAAKDIAFLGYWPAKPVRIECDHQWLVQAAQNLIDNAIKYTHSGGRVEVRVLARWDDKGKLQGRLEVEDNGIGIAPVHQARIFERFYRVDQADRRPFRPPGQIAHSLPAGKAGAIGEAGAHAGAATGAPEQFLRLDALDGREHQLHRHPKVHARLAHLLV
jgi:two-component system phosphate regulon sensor histidine kinase PhoR